MKTIRHSIFETNSSSCHSVCIRGKNNGTQKYLSPHLSIIKYDGQEYVLATFDEFGWGNDSYNDARTKFSYIMTMIVETECQVDWNDDIDYCRLQQYNKLKCSNGFKKVKDFAQSLGFAGVYLPDLEELEENSYHCFGYIDHQSCEYSCLQEFLDDYDMTLEEFVLDPNITLIIDHDNH